MEEPGAGPLTLAPNAPKKYNTECPCVARESPWILLSLIRHTYHQGLSYLSIALSRANISLFAQ